MINTGPGTGARERLTSKHHTRDVPYDLFGKTRFPTVFQTRQTVGGYGVRKPLPGLVITVGFSAQSYLRVHYGLTFMASFTYSMGPSRDIWYFSRTPLARALNPVPGNQSGRYWTVHDFVSLCRCCSGVWARTDRDGIDEELSGHQSSC